MHPRVDNYLLAYSFSPARRLIDQSSSEQQKPRPLYLTLRYFKRKYTSIVKKNVLQGRLMVMANTKIGE